ncbi:hypothetical protein FR943_03960 [Mycobacterium sp. TNTM28]|uniref:Anti-sigma-M factor RsmA n=1 Tax=[Mycobacterium] fortunisiensis TaxID=2600579 RepID=A0ABS6KHH0_9MYCO|nr:hypothetical protein [[Mycobacterium] fortunisiensis]MBU9763004.1 hypothetical protein [[Mycobacterium] fortunisiensis]
MNGSTPRVPSDGPIPAELLADLQAGLLDDATAAQLRRQVRTDPQAGPAARATLAALDRVRRDLAHLGTDAESAPPVPAEVSARLSAALRAAPTRPPIRRGKLLAAIAGTGAAVVAAVVGVVVLLHPPGSAPSTLTSLGRITVAPPPAQIGLSDAQLLSLLSARPDLGPLADPHRREGCLAALGYPSDTPILGARPHEVAGRPGVLLVLPADRPDAVVGLVVGADCAAGHPATLADTVVNRPGKHP